MQTETIEVPQNLRGFIIGKKGWQIHKIRERSNAKVENANEGFRVTGTQEQIQVAKGIIKSITEARQVRSAQNTVSKEILVPLYMKLFMFCDNEKRAFTKIREETKTEIDNTKEGFRLIGKQQENVQAAEDMINKWKMSIEGSLLRVKVPRDYKVISSVIGRRGKISMEIQEETQTNIILDESRDEPYFCIKGETKEQQHKAKLKIKEMASSHVKMDSNKFETYQTMRFVDDSFVDAENDEFSLRQQDNPPSRWVGPRYKIIDNNPKVNISTEEKEIEGIENLCEKVHQTLTQLEEHDRNTFQVDYVCHYGSVYMRNVDEDQESVKYTVQELKEKLGEQRDDAWKTNFDGGLKQLNVDELVKEFSSSESYREVVEPFTRYDFSVISPSCKSFKFKVTLRDDNGELKFSFLDPNKNSQDSLYKIGAPSVRHVKVHVIVLNTDIDCCLVIQTKFKKDSYTPEGEQLEELKILKEFLDKHLKLENGDLDLMKLKELPEDFDLNYWRKSERRIFDNNGFGITVSKEESENVDGLELRKNVVYKNDVEIHLNNSDKKLSIQKCQSDQTRENDVQMHPNDSDELSIQKEQKDQTRKYVRKVLSFARVVQRFLSAG